MNRKKDEKSTSAPDMKIEIRDNQLPDTPRRVCVIVFRGISSISLEWCKYIDWLVRWSREHTTLDPRDRTESLRKIILHRIASNNYPVLCDHNVQKVQTSFLSEIKSKLYLATRFLIGYHPQGVLPVVSNLDLLLTPTWISHLFSGSHSSGGPREILGIWEIWFLF